MAILHINRGAAVPLHHACVLSIANLLPSTPHSTSPQAYLSVAPHVARFPEYFEPLAWHLLRSKLRHWEKGLRELAARALAGAHLGLLMQHGRLLHPMHRCPT